MSTAEQTWWDMLTKKLQLAGLDGASLDAMKRVESLEFIDEGIRVVAKEFVCQWIFGVIKNYEDLVHKETGFSLSNFRFRRTKPPEKVVNAPE
jgi:hypothetical protein